MTPPDTTGAWTP
jgi:hypothetical protein